MSTKAQIKANQQNSQKSTGPQTAEGKVAVSQNAVKHGLFTESVIKGKNEADYEAFHENMLAEIDPIGTVETMLAERAVNLAWRLRRAERMENEVIEDMIGRKVTNNPARRERECYYINQEIYRGDPRMDLDDLPLGRIATNDFAYCRVIDRMLMYERRIENSLHKTLRELERRQLIRQFQQQEAEQELPRQEPNQFRLAPNTAGGSITDLEKQNQSLPSPGNLCHRYPKSEYLNPKRVKEDTVLKKQSQSVPGQMGATPYLEGDYGNKPAGPIEENKANSKPIKANQDQFQAPTRQKGAVKKEKLPTAANRLTG